jgi:hypothetical protein
MFSSCFFIKGKDFMGYPSSFIAPLSGYVKTNLVIDLDAYNIHSYPGSGTVWYDLTGRGNNANLINGVNWNPDGFFALDGTNDYIVFPNSPDLDFPGDFTLEMVWFTNPWLNSIWDGGASFHGWGHLYRRYDNGYSLPGAWTFETAGDDGWANVWEGPGANFGLPLFSGMRHTRRRWNQLIWTRTGTSMKMYHNGMLCSNITQSYDLSSEYDMIFGRFNEALYMANFIMSMRIYQKGFNSQEVMQNYNFNKLRFLKRFSNIANGEEAKHYSFVGNPSIPSSAKYATDQSIGTVRRNYTKAHDDFKDQIYSFTRIQGGESDAIINLNIATEKKAYISNLNQESMNSVMNQLEVLNKMSQKLYNDILLLKSGSINKNGVYPSSKYR